MAEAFSTPTVEEDTENEVAESLAFPSETTLDPEQEQQKRLAIRLSHLGISLEDDTVLIKAEEIRQGLGISSSALVIRAAENGIKAVLRPSERGEVSYYPSYLKDFLQDEQQWRREYLALDKYLTVDQITEVLGRSRGWTEAQIKTLGVRPSKKENRKWHPMNPLYNKSVIKSLRELSLSIPSENGWWNLRQLQQATGQDREWIARRLLEAGLVPEQRRSSLTGHILNFYSPESLNVIEQAIINRPKPGGNWLTVEAIERKLGKSEGWIRRRIKKFDYLAAVKQDDNGVSRLHYPNYVIECLQGEKDELESYPFADDFLPLYRLAQATGKSESWVKNRLSLYNVEPEPRRNQKGGVGLHYPPETVSLLLDILKSEES